MYLVSPLAESGRTSSHQSLAVHSARPFVANRFEGSSREAKQNCKDIMNNTYHI